MKFKELVEILNKEFPNPKAELKFKKPLELLIATVLSAQCTDKRVNLVTKELFKRYKTVEDYAGANPRKFEEEIKTTGFYRNKAKNIIACCQKLSEDFDGKIPNTMDELLTLPGVGRKTANVLLGNGFGVPSVVVDTHVKRVSQRLRFTLQDDPDGIEMDLKDFIPRSQWTRISHQMLLFGRYRCKAKSPICQTCGFQSVCPWFKENPIKKEIVYK